MSTRIPLLYRTVKHSDCACQPESRRNHKPRKGLTISSPTGREGYPFGVSLPDEWNVTSRYRAHQSSRKDPILSQRSVPLKRHFISLCLRPPATVLSQQGHTSTIRIFTNSVGSAASANAAVDPVTPTETPQRRLQNPTAKPPQNRANPAWCRGYQCVEGCSEI
jgi:hypothetical protein